MQPSQATALKCLLCCGFTIEKNFNLTSERLTEKNLPYCTPSWRLSYLQQWSSAGPCSSKRVVSKGSHLELPAFPHTLPVPSNDVQVVIENHCGETPLVSPEREFCKSMPASALLWPFQSEDMSGRFRLWVVPGSQVLLPEAAQTSSSVHPQADDLILLLYAQAPEIEKATQTTCIIMTVSGQQWCYQRLAYVTRWGISSRFLLM